VANLVTVVYVERRARGTGYARGLVVVDDRLGSGSGSGSDSDSDSDGVSVSVSVSVGDGDGDGDGDGVSDGASDSPWEVTLSS